MQRRYVPATNRTTEERQDASVLEHRREQASRSRPSGAAARSVFGRDQFVDVVLTHDLDFSAILAATKGEKPSVVQIRSEDVSPEGIGKSVIEALRQMSDLLEQGALLTVDPVRARLRVLPLQRK